MSADGHTVAEAVEDPTAPSEYGITQVALKHEVSEEELGRMREEYGRVRTYFKTRPERYTNVQRWLNQARFGTTYDQYLTTSVFYAVGASLGGLVVGVLFAAWLASLGVIGGLTNPFKLSGDWILLIANNKLLFATLGLGLGSAILLGGGVWSLRYYHPRTVVSTRRQAINIELPHAIVFMYALSHGGMDLTEVLRTIATAEDTYGEISREFGMVINDIDLFGSDLFTAVQNARNLTPSESFEQFLDDMLTVLDSGGDMTVFLEQQSENYLREAKEEQESFLETLAVLAEVFVVGFVAAPLFLIVTLVVISLLGGSTIAAIQLLIYLVMPLGVIGFVFLIDTLSQPFEQSSIAPVEPDTETAVTPDEEDERFQAYRDRQRRREFRDFLADPWQAVRDRPLLSAAFSTPFALLVPVVASVSGVASPGTMTEQPVWTTTVLFVAPFVVVAVPLSYTHERKRRRENEIARRFPDTLNVLSSANKMGIRLSEALDLVSRWSTGVLANELRHVRNDVAWNHDPSAALLAFGRRLRVPQLSRSMKLIAEGIRASSDLSRVLAIAAEDTRNREKMERARRRDLMTYIAVVVIGFLVYLLIVAILDATYLAPLAAFGEQEQAAGRDLPVSFANVPVEAYRLLFFHSALIQAVGSGLIAGKLADNELLSGLKYSLALVAVSMGAFLII